MGPAIAVLVIPTKGRATVATLVPTNFLELKSDEAPTIKKFSDPEYGEVYLLMADPPYNFSRKDMGLRMAQEDPWNDAGMFFEDWEGNVATTVKHTEIDLHGRPGMRDTLVPSSQTFRKLSLDMMRYWVVFDNDPSDLPANDSTLAPSIISAYETSLDIAIERRGPAMRLSTYCFRGNISVVSIGEDKSLRCYTSPPNFKRENYNYLFIDKDNWVTVCIPVGSGWAKSRNDHAQFLVGTADSSSIDPQTSNLTSVNIYSADRSVYLNTSTQHCAKLGANAHDVGVELLCDWDAIWLEPPHPGLRQLWQAPRQVIEYDFEGRSTGNSSVHTHGSYSTPWCHSFVNLTFETYKTSVSHTRNNTYLTSDDLGHPVYIHPSWVLAAWAVDHKGTVHDNMTDTAPSTMIHALGRDLMKSKKEHPQFDDYELHHQHIAITSSAVTLITFDEQQISINNTAAAPVLDTKITALVWMYKLESRTSKLGAAVAGVGGVAAIFNAILILALRKHYYKRPGALSLFLGALARAEPPPKVALEARDKNILKTMESQIRFVTEDGNPVLYYNRDIFLDDDEKSS